MECRFSSVIGPKASASQASHDAKRADRSAFPAGTKEGMQRGELPERRQTHRRGLGGKAEAPPATSLKDLRLESGSVRPHPSS
jgi:hypothetical protein